MKHTEQISSPRLILFFLPIQHRPQPRWILIIGQRNGILSVFQKVEPLEWHARRYAALHKWRGLFLGLLCCLSRRWRGDSRDWLCSGGHGRGRGRGLWGGGVGEAGGGGSGEDAVGRVGGLGARRDTQAIAAYHFFFRRRGRFVGVEVGEAETFVSQLEINQLVVQKFDDAWTCRRARRVLPMPVRASLDSRTG